MAIALISDYLADTGSFMIILGLTLIHEVLFKIKFIIIVSASSFKIQR